MDPNPKNFQILSQILMRIRSFKPKPDDFDIEQPQQPSNPQFPEPKFTITDPQMLAAMKGAISDIVQARSMLSAVGPRPDHEVVDATRTRIAGIEAQLEEALNGVFMELRPENVNEMSWRGRVKERENRVRDLAEEEIRKYRAVVELEEMYLNYERLVRDAEERLSRIYKSAEGGEGGVGDGGGVEEVNEDVVGVLKEASEGNAVEKVELSGQGLRILPEAFGRIQGVVVLDVSDNELKLNISLNVLELLPDSLGLLQNLKILNVSGNKLCALPDSICYCRSLVELDVSFNNLTYLPTNIGHELVNLQRLSIQLNKICSLPSSVGEMKSLCCLDAHFNELRGLPRSIGKLTNLEILNLGSNFAEMKELPETFGDLINMRKLDLSNNHIHALPDTFGLLENLTKLNLDQNPLEIPPAEFVKAGVEAIKAFMVKRWLDMLLEGEENRKLKTQAKEQEAQTGWLTRSTSWLKSKVSVVSGNVTGYIGNVGKTGDPIIDEAR